MNLLSLERQQEKNHASSRDYDTLFKIFNTLYKIYTVYYEKYNISQRFKKIIIHLKYRFRKLQFQSGINNFL